MRSIRLSRLILLGLMIDGQSVRAEIFCASSPAKLTADLVLAQANGSDDEIRIVAGRFKLTTEPKFSSNEDYALEISGGWNAACTQPQSGSTVLDGQGQVRAMALLQNSTLTAATISVHDITFEHGSTPNNGGGLYVFGRNGAITVERTVGAVNTANYGGALEVETAGPLLVRNNLFWDNTAVSGAGADVSSTGPSTFITGNTIVLNVTTQFDGCAGLYTSASPLAGAWVSNNILWNNNANGGHDYCTYTQHVLLYNDIGTSLGSAADMLSTGNVSLEPGFAPCTGLLCFDFHLGGHSPLIDAGYDHPPGGIGSYDVAYEYRFAGAHVDIGAYELDRIFADGFE